MEVTFWVIVDECSVAQGMNGNKLVILDGSAEESDQGYIDASISIRVGEREAEGALIERNSNLTLSVTRWVTDAEYTEIAQRIMAVKGGNGTVSVWLNVEGDTVEMDEDGMPNVDGTGLLAIGEMDIIYQLGSKGEREE
ncbi:MAG: hypothetical protein FD153_227 [Rhodospirillaceae bacterium]|nr:MAG: hypothetical protein FD153_227 [Rhodospirillaceae bacterium]